jgi:citrate synthase
MMSGWTRWTGTSEHEEVRPGPGRASLSITDNRTGRTYEVAIEDGTIRATALRNIKVDDDDGLMSYDPAYGNTASCRSSITFIDGDKGILEYRGYPIQELADKSTYLEVAYLLINGELPSPEQFDEWNCGIAAHGSVDESIREFMNGFRFDAHPMGMLLASVGAMSTLYPEARAIKAGEVRNMQITRLIAKMPTLAAFSYRHNRGMPYVYPDDGLSYAGNFLSMIYKLPELQYEPDPRLEHALDVLFILHADHEQNSSTSAVRNVGSSRVDPYSAVAAGIAALYGPLHGGANEAVIRMLRRIELTENVSDFIRGVKDGNERLMGFGHRVYKNFDPRVSFAKRACDDVFQVTGKTPLLDIAVELEKIALEDEYFVTRRLYPNLDFYTAVIYEALGMPVEMFPVLFALGRTSGWIAQWLEMVDDPEQKIARPRQIYTGPHARHYPEGRPSGRRRRKQEVPLAGQRLAAQTSPADVTAAVAPRMASGLDVTMPTPIRASKVDEASFRRAVFEEEWHSLLDQSGPRLLQLLQTEAAGWLQLGVSLDYFPAGDAPAIETAEPTSSANRTRWRSNVSHGKDFDYVLAACRATLTQDRMEYLSLVLDGDDSRWANATVAIRSGLQATQPEPASNSA